jgi:hypothetical protein
MDIIHNIVGVNANVCVSQHAACPLQNGTKWSANKYVSYLLIFHRIAANGIDLDVVVVDVVTYYY